MLARAWRVRGQQLGVIARANSADLVPAARELAGPSAPAVVDAAGYQIVVDDPVAPSGAGISSARADRPGSIVAPRSATTISASANPATSSAAALPPTRPLEQVRARNTRCSRVRVKAAIRGNSRPILLIVPAARARPSAPCCRQCCRISDRC